MSMLFRVQSRWVIPLALMLFLGSASAARAQSGDPTLLVLESLGAPDATVAAQLVEVLSSVGRSRGYHVVRPAAGSVVGALDAHAGADLSAVVQRSAVHRGVALWLTTSGTDYEVHVGLASNDGTACSIRLRVGALDLSRATEQALSTLLPPPFVATPSAWAPPLSVERTAAEGPAPIPVVEERQGRETGLLISGAVILGVGWITAALIGLFGGYEDRSCLSGWGCTPPPPGGTSWRPAWDNFRATSLLPLVGPWIQLAVKPEGDDMWPVWLIANGVIQATGAVLLAIGIAVFDGSGDEAAPTALVVPDLGMDRVGLTLLGTF